MSMGIIEAFVNGFERAKKVINIAIQPHGEKIESILDLFKLKNDDYELSKDIFFIFLELEYLELPIKNTLRLLEGDEEYKYDVAIKIFNEAKELKEDFEKQLIKFSEELGKRNSTKDYGGNK